MTYSPISTWQRPAHISCGDAVRDAYWRVRGWMMREASISTTLAAIVVMSAVALAI